MCSRGGGDTLSPIRINLAGLDLETFCKRGEAPCSSFTAPPLVSFTQPPPTYNRPRPPLFPVPPPGSCLLPPPPLPTKVKENPNISNSHWAEAPPLIKANSWPSTAASGAGDFLFLHLPAPCPREDFKQDQAGSNKSTIHARSVPLLHGLVHAAGGDGR